jgi:hypothetical protein
MTRFAMLVHGGLTLILLAACASYIDVPSNVTVGARPAKAGTVTDADFAAQPQIAAVWLSSLALRRGSTWTGAISTSSNVASVEVRTDSFSFSVPKSGPGSFEFSYAIPDLPPYLRRRFLLHIVARNAAGDKVDETLPIEID